MACGKKAGTRARREVSAKELRACLVSGSHTNLRGERITLPSQAIEDAIHRVSPMVTISSVKRGGSSVKIPTLLHPGQQRKLGVRLLVEGALSRAKAGVPVSRAFVQEVRGVLKNQDCYSVNRYRSLQKEAKANRMFVR
jgi:ribosomal protein S7